MTIKSVMKIKSYWNHKTVIKTCPVNNCNIKFLIENFLIFRNKKDNKLFNEKIIIGQIKYV